MQCFIFGFVMVILYWAIRTNIKLDEIIDKLNGLDSSEGEEG